ncbi:YdcF family protein [Plastoroseomonas hellenica]|uniref:YdcF family protein n=1 Tax=Plastoroseomonas hellenica TaxID=2687306 RepID=UPI001BA913BE
MTREPSSRAAIIIFGAAVRPDGGPSPALRDRVLAALRHGERLSPQPLYLPTGARGRFGPEESAVMAAILSEAGVPATRIVQETSGTDTLSSVLACVRLLRGIGHAGPVLAASSPYHLPRCVALLRLAGLPARPVRTCGMPASRRWTKRWYWRLREVPALPYDVALMLWYRLTGRA